MTSWRVRVEDQDGNHRRVILEGDSSGDGASLVEALDRLGLAGGPLLVNGRDVSRVPSIAQLGLTDGQLIRRGDEEDLRRQPARPDVSMDLALDPTSDMFLVVTTGPDAGKFVAVADASLVLGRSSSADVSVNDEWLSSTHLRLRRAGPQSVVITDLDSRNGTMVEDEPLMAGREQTVSAGTHIGIGRSTLVIVMVAVVDRAALGDPEGPNIEFPRRFRSALDPLPAKLERPRAPIANEPSAASWWRSLAPMVTGVGFAVMTGRWEFLILVALAPLIFAFDTRRQRRERAAEAAERAAQYQAELTMFNDSVRSVRDADRRRQRFHALDGATASLYAALRHQRLWERSPSDDDFGHLTVGFASLPTSVEAGDDDALLGRPRQSGMPVTAALGDLGSIGVVGQEARVRATLRGLTIGLAATHSPVDVRLWLFSDEAATTEWEYLTWLSHTQQQPGHRSLATDKASRAELRRTLRQILRSRLAAQASHATDEHLPLHVVIVDGAHQLPTADLTELLIQGPAVGIIGVVADPSAVPEGVQGLLELGSDPAEASFRSRLQPLVTNVHTTELSTERAHQAAVAMAPLRPAGAVPDEKEREVHLVDLLGFEPTAESIASRWEHMSPRTSAVVGLATDSVMSIDIARHGPHGLIGGMSGSGKTEFLMTLLTSLCLDNHPDDLNFVIVDFKGGVDHSLTSKLPHVIAMSTNLDVATFKRTIDLLDAEQRRRQELLSRVGGDLDAYRQARTTNADLPPLPRLVVVVDEFSELLASDEGRARLEELVRVTRIGRALGVHLLLVTQNFEGQLPPQVEANAGLRVCLRVMKSGHSKVVIDSPLAATIPDSHVGAAYARLQGGDLIAFQTARVAGSHRRGTNHQTQFRARYSHFESDAATQEETSATNRPLAESDMAEIIEHLQHAAKHTGWLRPTIPWPTELGGNVTLASLLRHCRRPSVGPNAYPVGMQDKPCEQAQTPLWLGEQDEHLMFLGSRAAETCEAMVTAATSAAAVHSPEQLQVHGIDLDGSGLGRLTDLPHGGTVATRDDALALRLIRQLHALAAERRSVAGNREDIGGRDPSRSHVSGWEATRPDGRILLLVSGADRLVRRGDEGRSLLLGPLQMLLAEAVDTGLQVWLSGLPTIADSRLGDHVDRRFVFGLSGDTNPTSYGVSRDLLPSLQGPLRAVDTQSGFLVQWAVVGRNPPETLGSGRGGMPSRLSALLHELHSKTTAPPRLDAVRWPLMLNPSDFPTADSPRSPGTGWLCVGRSETGEWSWIDGEEDGPMLAIMGSSGSGRSNALLSIAFLARNNGWRTLGAAGSRRSALAKPLSVASSRGSGTAGMPVTPNRASSDTAVEESLTGGMCFDEICRPEELAARVTSQPTDRPLAVFLDDTHRIESEHLPDAWPNTVFVVAGSADFFDGRSDGRRRLPSCRTALILAPAGARDGTAAGLSRIAEEHRLDPRPGKGILAVSGEASPVLVPLLTAPSGGTAASRSNQAALTPA